LNAGTHNVTFYVVNSDLITKNDSVSLNYEPDFSINASHNESLNYYVNDDVNVNFSLTESNNASSNYTMYFTSSGNGTLNYDGTTYTQGQVFAVDSGSSNAVYTPTSSGDHFVQFFVVNDNSLPISHSDSITVSLLAPSFDFSIYKNSPADEDFVNLPVSLNYTISNIEGGDFNYTMKFNTADNSMNGYIIYNGTQYYNGDVFNLDLNNLNMEYYGMTYGDHDITFTVVNDYIDNVTRSDDLLFVYTLPNFTFNEYRNVPSGTTYDLGDNIPLEFELNETEVTGNIYTMYFTTDDNEGELTIGGNVYNANELINISLGTFSGQFKTTNLKSIENLTFYVDNNETNNIVVEDTDTIVYKELNFNLSQSGFPPQSGNCPNYVSYRFNLNLLDNMHSQFSYLMQDTYRVKVDVFRVINGVENESDNPNYIQPIDQNTVSIYSGIWTNYYNLQNFNPEIFIYAYDGLPISYNIKVKVSVQSFKYGHIETVENTTFYSCY